MAQAVAPVPGGGVYFASRHDGNPVLARLSPDCEAVWTRAMDHESYTRAGELAVDADGGVCVVVHTDSGLGNAIIRFSATGELLWSRQVSGGQVTRIRSMTSLPDGMLVLSGRVTRNYGYQEMPDSLRYESEMPLLICLDGDGGWQAGHYLELIDELPTEWDWEHLIWGDGPGYGSLDVLQPGPDGALYGMGAANTAARRWEPVDGSSDAISVSVSSCEVVWHEMTSVLIDEPVPYRNGELEQSAHVSPCMLVTRLR